MNYGKITFPPAELSIKTIDGQKYVWDNLRGRYLLLTPEEVVRRHAIAFLISHCSVEPQTIAQEYPVSLNGTAQRADIVVVGRDLRPAILVECKATDIKITQQTLAQAIRYNSVLGARYIMLTNGENHFCYEVIAGKVSPMKGFPKMVY